MTEPSAESLCNRWRRDGPTVLELRSVTFAAACAFIRQYHRHLQPPRGHKFSLAVHHRQKIAGVIVVGRPVARRLDDGETLEVTRCCTDGTRNACSKLLGAAWRATRALGYRRLVTYTLASESGVSLRAAGWRITGEMRGGCWNRTTRPRADRSPAGAKRRWEPSGESHRGEQDSPS